MFFSGVNFPGGSIICIIRPQQVFNRTETYISRLFRVRSAAFAPPTSGSQSIRLARRPSNWPSACHHCTRNTMSTLHSCFAPYTHTQKLMVLNVTIFLFIYDRCLRRPVTCTPCLIHGHRKTHQSICCHTIHALGGPTMNEYLRPVDAALYFPKTGALLFLSEFEADALLKLFWRPLGWRATDGGWWWLSRCFRVVQTHGARPIRPKIQWIKSDRRSSGLHQISAPHFLKHRSRHSPKNERI